MARKTATGDFDRCTMTTTSRPFPVSPCAFLSTKKNSYDYDVPSLYSDEDFDSSESDLFQGNVTMSGPMTTDTQETIGKNETAMDGEKHAAPVNTLAQEERPSCKKLGLGLLALVAAAVLAAVVGTSSLSVAQSYSLNVTFASYVQQKQQECYDANPCTSDYYSDDLKACRFAPIAGCTNNAAMADILLPQKLRPQCYDANPCTIDYYNGRTCTFPPIPGCGNGVKLGL